MKVVSLKKVVSLNKVLSVAKVEYGSVKVVLGDGCGRLGEGVFW